MLLKILLLLLAFSAGWAASYVYKLEAIKKLNGEILALKRGVLSECIEIAEAQGDIAIRKIHEFYRRKGCD